jgi:hypothetical protein
MLLTGLSCHDTHTKFHKGWFRRSKVIRGGYTDRKDGDRIIQLQQSRLKIAEVPTHTYPQNICTHCFILSTKVRIYIFIKLFLLFEIFIHHETHSI